MSIPIRLDPISHGADDPLEALMALKQSGGAERDPLDELMAPKRGAVPPVSADAPSALPRNRERPIAPSVLSHMTNVGRGLAGGRAVIAGSEAMFNNLSGKPDTFAAARDRQDADTDRIGGPASLVEHLIGGIPAAMMLPGGAAKTAWQAVKLGAKAGAGLGAADAALSADDLSLEDRAVNTAKGGAAGALAGGALGAGARVFDKGSELVGLAKRIKSAKPFGEVAHEIDDNITAATRANYGQAEAEGVAAGGSSPELTKALEHPLIKPYADIVRESHGGKNASDAQVAQQAYKLISRQRGGFKRQMAEKYDAKIDMQAEDLKEAASILKAATARKGVATTVIPAPETAQSPAPDIRTALREHQARPGIAAARREGTVAQQKAREGLERHGAENIVSPSLRGAPTEQVIETETPGVMPSFPKAVSEKARMEGEREAFNTIGDATPRLARGAPVSSKKVLKQSSEAIKRLVGKMSPEEAQKGLAALYGRSKPEIKIKAPNASSTSFLGNLVQPATRLNRLSPVENMLNKQAGNATRDPLDMESVLRSLGILNAPLANR